MKSIAAVLATAVLVGLGAPAQAQEKAQAATLTAERYFEMERLSDAQISPDGRRIIYTRQQVNRLEDKWEPALWIVEADGTRNRFFAKGSGARWSPDSRRVLYIAEDAAARPQINVQWVDADGPPSQITRAVDRIADARWSPDGRHIAFTMLVPEKPKWTIAMPAEPKGAKWTPAPKIVESLHYRQDQVGFLEDEIGRAHV